MKKLTKAALLASAVVAAGAFMGCSSDVDSKDTTVETFKAKEIENLKITNVDNRALVIKWDETESVGALDLYAKVGDDNWTFVESDVRSPKVILPTFAAQFADKTEYKFKLVNKKVTENPATTDSGYAEHYVYKKESVAKEIAYKFDLKKDEVIPAYKSKLPAYADADVVLWTNEDKTSYEISVPKSDVYGARYEVYLPGADVQYADGAAITGSISGNVGNTGVQNYASRTATIPLIAQKVVVKVYKTIAGSTFFEESDPVAKTIEIDNTKDSSNLPKAVSNLGVTSENQMAKLSWSSTNDPAKTDYKVYRVKVNTEKQAIDSFTVVDLAATTEVTYDGATTYYVAYDKNVNVNDRWMYVVVASNAFGTAVKNGTSYANTASVVITDKLYAAGLSALSDDLTDTAPARKSDDPLGEYVPRYDNNFVVSWTAANTMYKYKVWAVPVTNAGNGAKIEGEALSAKGVQNDGKDHFVVVTKLNSLKSTGISKYVFYVEAEDEDGTKITKSINLSVADAGYATLTGAAIYSTGAKAYTINSKNGEVKALKRVFVTGTNLEGKKLTVKALVDGVVTSATGDVVKGKADADDVETRNKLYFDAELSGDVVEQIVVQLDNSYVASPEPNTSCFEKNVSVN